MQVVILGDKNKCPSIVRCPMHIPFFFIFGPSMPFGCWASQPPLFCAKNFKVFFLTLTNLNFHEHKFNIFSGCYNKLCFCHLVILSHRSKSDNHKSLVPSNTPILVIKRLYCTFFEEITQMIECHYFTPIHLYSHGLWQKLLKKGSVYNW